jgi:hypothetical protein
LCAVDLVLQVEGCQFGFLGCRLGGGLIVGLFLG